MKRILTAVITAIEAGAVALAGLVLVAIPALLLWIVTFQLGSDPAELFSALSAVWLLGHDVPLTFALDAQQALSFGLAPEAMQFTLSLAPLGIGLISAYAGARIGWRLGRRGGAGAVGLPAGVLGFAAVTLLPASGAQELLDLPQPLAVLIPTLFFGIPAVAGFLVRAAHDDHEWWHRALRQLHRGVARLGWHQSSAVVAALGDALRLAAATLSVLLALAALGVGVSLLTGYVQVITLSQHLQLDPVGSIAIFVLQLVFLPIAVIWGLAWFSGSGFAIGTGTSVTPFDTLLGPVPALPFFGAIPSSWGSWGVLAVLLVVLCALGCGGLFARKRGPGTVAREAGVALAAAAMLGLAAAGLAALATGSIGPDRLEATGPDPWLTGGLLAAEVAVGLGLGALASRWDVARGRDRVGALGGSPGLDDALHEGATVGSVSGSALRDGSLPYGVERAVRREDDVTSGEDLATDDYGTAGLLDSDAHEEGEVSPLHPVRALHPKPRREPPVFSEPQVFATSPGSYVDRLNETLERVESAGVVPAPDRTADQNEDHTADAFDDLSNGEASDAAEPPIDPVSDEEALVRAYAWDDDAFAEPPQNDAGTEGSRGAASTAALPWWRQKIGKKAGRETQRQSDRTDSAGSTLGEGAQQDELPTATDLPTVDLGNDPLGKTQPLD